jgi:hypothetical protein
MRVHSAWLTIALFLNFSIGCDKAVKPTDANSATAVESKKPIAPDDRSAGDKTMKIRLSVLAIEGNHLNEIADVFKKKKYVIEKSFTVSTGKKVSDELAWSPDRDRVAKAAYFASGWTFVVDPEMVLTTDDIWLDFSRKWDARVVGWFCDSASDTYGLTVFQSGKKQRQIFSVDGDVKVNEGNPLAEESDMKWNKASAKSVLNVTKRIGAEYDFLADREYTIFQLNESQIGKSD